jgi:hypothetical protein
MESRFEAPANKEFFNGIGESQPLRHTALNVRFRRRDRRFVTTALTGTFGPFSDYRTCCIVV